MSTKYNFFWFFVFFLIFFSSYGYAQSYYEKGEKEYFYGDLNNSIALFTTAIQNNQELAKSHMYRGAAKIFLHMYAQSKLDLDSSKKIDSTYYKLYYYYGKLYLFEGNYVLALKYSNDAIAINKQDAAVFDQRGVIKGLMKNFKGAIADENEAIKLDSTKEIYFTDRGFTKTQQKQYREAILDYNKSIQIQPNQKAYANRGLAYSLIGEHLKAVDDYTKSLAINAEDFITYYYRGVSYKSLKKNKEACNDFIKSKNFNYLPALKALKNIKCDGL